MRTTCELRGPTQPFIARSDGVTLLEDNFTEVLEKKGYKVIDRRIDFAPTPTAHLNIQHSAGQSMN